MSYQKVVISEFGPPEVLQLVEVKTLPEPKEKEVRVRVVSVGASFTDTMIRKGLYPDVKDKPPFVPGYDYVGVVDAVGAQVTEYAKGDWVADLCVIGAYSEYLCAQADRLTRVPQGIDTGEAVALILSYTTAYQMLKRFIQLNPGDPVLVHGAGGAVGSALVQLGRWMGLHIYGTASKSKHSLVESLGAIPIDYRDPSWYSTFLDQHGASLRAVFDPLGGNSFRRSFELLQRGGMLLGYGFYQTVQGKGGSIAKDFLKIKLWDILPNGKSARFYSIAALRAKHPNWFRDDLGALFDLLVNHEIRPVVGKRLPLGDAIEAHRLVEDASIHGKLVLDVSTP